MNQPVTPPTLNYVEILAKYLRDIAERGGYPSPNLLEWARVTGISVTVIRDLKHTLENDGRLSYSYIKPTSIDGQAFTDIPIPDDVQLIKQTLMKYFRPVYDPYTIRHPTRTPRKQPTELILGHMRVDWDECVQMATYLSKNPDAIE